MKVAICDDVTADRKVVRDLIEIGLAAHKQTAEIREYEHGLQLISDVESGEFSPDLIIMDIFIPVLSGLEAAKKLRALHCDAAIIFLTSSPDFALQSYEVSAFYYLLKPINKNQLHLILQKFLQSFSPKTICLHHEEIALSDIILLKSQNKKIVLTMKTGRTLEFYGKMHEMEALLSDSCFLRCHQSYIINMNHVLRIDNGSFLMSSGEEALIRKKEYSRLRRVYFDFIVRD